MPCFRKQKYQDLNAMLNKLYTDWFVPLLFPLLWNLVRELASIWTTELIRPESFRLH